MAPTRRYSRCSKPKSRPGAAKLRRLCMEIEKRVKISVVSRCHSSQYSSTPLSRTSWAFPPSHNIWIILYRLGRRENSTNGHASLPPGESTSRSGGAPFNNPGIEGQDTAARVEPGPGAGGSSRNMVPRELLINEVAGVREGAVRAEGVATAEMVELEMFLCKPPESAVMYLQSVFRGSLLREKYTKLKVRGRAGVGGGEGSDRCRVPSLLYNIATLPSITVARWEIRYKIWPPKSPHKK